MVELFLLRQINAKNGFRGHSNNNFPQNVHLIHTLLSIFDLDRAVASAFPKAPQGTMILIPGSANPGYE